MRDFLDYLKDWERGLKIKRRFCAVERKLLELRRLLFGKGQGVQLEGLQNSWTGHVLWQGIWGFTGSLEEDQGHIWNWFEQEWEIQLAYQNLWWTEGLSLWEFWRGPNGSSWINLKFLIFSSHTPRRVKCSLVQGHSWGWKVSWWGSVLHPILLWMFHMRVHAMVVEQQSAYGWEHWFVKKHLAARKRVLAGMD